MVLKTVIAGALIADHAELQRALEHTPAIGPTKRGNTKTREHDKEKACLQSGSVVLSR